MTLCRLCALLFCSTLLACVDAVSNAPDAGGPGTLDAGPGAGSLADGGSSAAVCDVPADTNGLYAFLSQQQYRSFAKQPAIHGASGPHARFAQVYASAALANEPAGATSHPRCSAFVKEFYASATAQSPFGWAVSIKVADESTHGKAGDGWFWYENFHAGSNAAQGKIGDPVCTGCHFSAADDGVATVDFVKSPLPLR
jgi:hypothetical protein